MQPVAEGQLGDVAEMGVEPRQRLVHLHVALNSAGGSYSAFLGPRPDFGGDDVGAAWIEHLRLREFLDEIAQQGDEVRVLGSYPVAIL